MKETVSFLVTREADTIKLTISLLEEYRYVPKIGFGENENQLAPAELTHVSSLCCPLGRASIGVPVESITNLLGAFCVQEPPVSTAGIEIDPVDKLLREAR